MDEKQKLGVFRAQTENVRELERPWLHVNREINALILQKNDKGIEAITKLLALVYCALAEATFSKLIHTPYGLSISEIDQVKSQSATNGVKQGWLKCAELLVQRIGGSKSNHAPNVLQTIRRLIDDLIFDPSLIRNKLAHGQWAIALNRENTEVNTDITSEITSLTVVELYKRKYALQKLALILEDMIESPDRAHHRDYHVHLADLENKRKEMNSWTYQKKVDQLFLKKSRTPYPKQ